MLNGTFDAAHTALPFGVVLERVDGKETLFEIGDMRKDEVGHDFEVGPHLGDGTQEHHALNATEWMVADHDKATFFWDVLQLIRTDIDRDVHVLQQMVSKLTPLIISSSIKQTVDFAKPQRSIGKPRDTSAEEAFHAEGLFQIRVGYYFSHGD